MKKQCLICQNSFIYRGHNQKLCSQICFKKYRKEYKLMWKLKNKNRIKKYNKEYRKINKEKLSKQENEYRKLHREKYHQYKRKYRLIHKKEINLYFKNKRKLDLNFKIACNLRNRIVKVLKGINKSKSTLKLLTCSIELLKKHLEKRFTKGMSWSNYGKWHIDHIRPCASFDLSKPKEQKKCFNYTNLQPLWAKNNLRKNDN